MMGRLRFSTFYMIVFVSVTIRLIYVCYILQTTYIPDEYYQSVDGAYNIAFPPYVDDNNGDNLHLATQLAWEWSSSYQIRSYIPLLPYIGLFYLGKYAHINSI